MHRPGALSTDQLSAPTLHLESGRWQGPGVTGARAHHMLQFCVVLAPVGCEVGKAPLETDALDPNPVPSHTCWGVSASRVALLGLGGRTASA